MKESKDTTADKLDVLQVEKRTFPPSSGFSATAHIKSQSEYEEMYKRSISNPEYFWAEMAEQNLTWYTKWNKVLQYDFQKPDIKWFIGGKLNVAYNCLDRHIEAGLGNKPAIIWESDQGEHSTYTYSELLTAVNRCANVLKKLGVQKGDRITIYLPMIPELAITMLACARIGAIHSVVFAGFSARALRDRIQDCKSKIVITADQALRGAKHIPLKQTCDSAIVDCPTIEKVLVVKHCAGKIDWNNDYDLWWHDQMEETDISDVCVPEQMDAEDELFILYTSGSTGKPKGVLHTTAGYCLYANVTFRYIFDYHRDDVHFCTADIGWITGHSYIVYGPLSNGATTIMYEGLPVYPDPGRFWEICEKHKVNIFYTAPTAIRSLMREGESWTRKHDLSSLRVLGTVGEPINPEAWMWYHDNIGNGKIPIVDTWWQTETGGILITPLPGATTLKPGSAGRPFFGIQPKILKDDGSEAGVNEGGKLVIEKPWPGMLRGTFGDTENKRVKEIYFSQFPGKYFTGDSAHIDEDGDYWLMGRVDDVINTSGHRLGTAEIESALVSHSSVAEAAVVGYPHSLKGEGIYSFVTLKEGINATDELRKQLSDHVRLEIGPIATPDKIQFARGLPKTRSGKIMRRILRSIANNQLDALGDTSTLADPSVVDSLVQQRLL